MNVNVGPDPCSPLATDGDIAAINLESARRRAWACFAQDPFRPGVAEDIVDKERLVAQFFGDLVALDRLDALALRVSTEDSPRAALVQADVASMGHRFHEARTHLARAARADELGDAIERHLLALDQACGVALDAVVAARRRIADRSGKLEDWIPLGAVLADLERFAEADEVYRQRLYSYVGVSPFPLAWVCFQLGMLWHELVPVPDLNLAAAWYRKAIAYLPRYVKARIHLAEILASEGHLEDAEALLERSVQSRDPEVAWRLGDVLVAQRRFTDGELQLDAARLGFEHLLEKHFLAFADHAAEFYAGSGNDAARARVLAQANVANRPTRRAIRQANAIANCR